MPTRERACQSSSLLPRYAPALQPGFPFHSSMPISQLKPLLLHRLDSRLGCLQPISYYMIIDHDRSLEQNQRHPVLKMEPHGVFKEVTKQRTNKDHHQSVLPLAVVFHTCPHKPSEVVRCAWNWCERVCGIGQKSRAPGHTHALGPGGFRVGVRV